MAVESQPSQRLDRFLWFARLTKTRSLAQSICAGGHARIDGRRVDRAHVAVRVGNVLSLPIHDRVRIVRIEHLPTRRGPPAEARTCYTDLAPEAANDLHQAGNVDAGKAQP